MIDERQTTTRPCGIIPVSMRGFILQLFFCYVSSWTHRQSGRSASLHLVMMASESGIEQHGPSDTEHATTQASTIRILGVGGGIGSGKSTACKLLADQLGCISHIGMFNVFKYPHELFVCLLHSFVPCFSSTKTLTPSPILFTDPAVNA
jgi:hypothetical protein